MNARVKNDRNIDALAWGALFIWWGLTLLIKLPPGVGLIGVGLILLAANGARYYQGMGLSGFATAIGVLALVWGALELEGTVLPLALPVFPILLIVLGLIVLFGGGGQPPGGGRGGLVRPPRLRAARGGPTDRARGVT